LSENLIGSAENLNTVMPDLVTGGEAIADLLQSEGCVLQSLKLGNGNCNCELFIGRYDLIVIVAIPFDLIF